MNSRISDESVDAGPTPVAVRLRTEAAGGRGSALAGFRRDEARRQWLLEQRAEIDRQRLDLVVYTASKTQA